MLLNKISIIYSYFFYIKHKNFFVLTIKNDTFSKIEISFIYVKQLIYYHYFKLKQNEYLMHKSIKQQSTNKIFL